MSYPISKENFIKMYCEQRGPEEKKDLDFAEALYNCLEMAYNQGFEDGMKKAGAQHE